MWQSHEPGISTMHARLTHVTPAALCPPACPVPAAKGRAASAPVVVAALRGWAFLLTTVPSYQLTADFVEQHLGALAQLLNGSDVEVRGAAGEGVALLWHLGDLSSLPESPRPQRRSSDSFQNSLAALASGQVVGSPPTVGAALAATAAAAVGDAQPPAAYAQSPKQQQHEETREEEVDSLEAIVERMRDLAKNRGDASRLNKGDRASSRGTFRDLLAIIEVGGRWQGVGCLCVCFKRVGPGGCMPRCWPVSAIWCFLCPVPAQRCL